MFDPQSLDLTTPPPCPHRRTQFRKAPGSSLALLVCLDCGHQQVMSMEEALKRIIATDL